MRRSHPVPRALLLLVLFGLAAEASPANGQSGQTAGTSAAADTGVARGPQAGPLPTQTSFAQSQLRYDRVLNARVEARFQVKRLFRERGIRYPAADIFMRIFKRERELELWVRPSRNEPFALLKTYQICALAGELGPKRRQGDEQVPEGFYYIDHFNPQSDYHLSLHLDYPNRSDVLLGNGGALGGDIYIHGGCNSAGCLALTDEGIKEVYWISVEARGTGQTRIPVHIFPVRLTDAELPRLAQAFRKSPTVLRFWETLRPGFEYFEREHRVPRMNVTSSGAYRLAGEDRLNRSAPPGAPVPAAPGAQPLGTPLPGAAGTQPLGTHLPTGSGIATGASTETSPASQPGNATQAAPTQTQAQGVQPLGTPVHPGTAPPPRALGDTARAATRSPPPDSGRAVRPLPPRPGGGS